MTHVQETARLALLAFTVSATGLAGCQAEDDLLEDDILESPLVLETACGSPGTPPPPAVEVPCPATPALRPNEYCYAEADDTVIRAFVPGDIPVIRGMLIYFNESGANGVDNMRKNYRIAFARAMSFGSAATQFGGIGIERVEAVVRAFDKFAERSGRPELAHVPFIVDGLSLGGHNSSYFADRFPERTIALVSALSSSIAGIDSSDNSYTGISEGFKQVPSLYSRGELEAGGAAAKRQIQVQVLRANGARAAAYPQWGYEHENGLLGRAELQFFAEVVRLRYPPGGDPSTCPVALASLPMEAGYLADPESFASGFTKLYPFDQYPGDESLAFWLPNEATAVLYRAQSTFDAPPGASTLRKRVTSVQLTSPSEAPPNASVTLSAVIPEIADPVRVEFYRGATKIGEVAAPGPYQLTANSGPVGTSAITAIAVDGAGDLRVSRSISMTSLGSAAP